MSLFLNPGNPPDLAEMRSPLRGKEGPLLQGHGIHALGHHGPDNPGHLQMGGSGRLSHMEFAELRLEPVEYECENKRELFL